MSFYKKTNIGKVFGIDKDDFDISDYDEVESFFNKNVTDPHVDIDYVIHCAAATDTAAIEEDPAKYYATNVLGAYNVARSCVHNNMKMIFISTDYVLSELSEWHHGYDMFPVNQYGIQMSFNKRVCSIRETEKN